jgi:hypothetical protein
MTSASAPIRNFDALATRMQARFGCIICAEAARGYRRRWPQQRLAPSVR